MAENTPLQGSHFVEDGYLDKAIKDMEAFRDKTVSTLSEISKSADDLQKALNKVSTSQKESTKALDEAEKKALELVKAQEKQNKTLSETEKELEKLKIAQKQQKKISDLEIKANELKTRSLDELKAKYKLNETILSSLTKEELENSEVGRKLVRENKNLSLEIKELTQVQKGLHNQMQISEEDSIKLKNAQKKEKREKELLIKINSEAEDSYNKLSAQYSLNKIRLNAMSKEQRKNTKEGKQLESQTAAIFEEMKALQEVTGKHTLSVGDYANKVGELIPSLGGAANSLKAVGTQMWALVMNPIGATIAAIGAALVILYKSLSRTTKGLEALNNAVSILDVVFNALSDTLNKIISGEISVFDAFSETSKAIGENVKATIQLNKVRKDLERQTVESTLAQAKFNKEIAALEGIAEADSKSLEAREKAAIELSKVRVQASKERVEQVKREQQEQILALVKTEATQKEVNDALRTGNFEVLKSNLEKTSSTEDYREALNALIDSQANVIDAEAELIRVQNDSSEKLALIRLDQFEQALDLELDLTDRRKSINEKELSREETTTERKRELVAENQRIIEESFNRQIELFNELGGVQVDENRLLNSSAEQVRQYAKELGFSERAVNRLREVIIEKQQADEDNLNSLRDISKEEKKIEEERIKKADKDLKDARNAAIKQADQKRDFIFSEIDILNESEDVKTKLRLQAERDRLKKVIDLNKTMGGELTDLQIGQMENALKGINKELQSFEKENEKRDIYSLVGLKLTDEEKEQAKEAVNFVLDNINELLQAEIDAADKVIEKRGEEVDKSQSKLNKEIENREKGYANQVLQSQRELELNKKKQDEAIKQREKALKVQQALDEAAQISSLITAAAQIWSSLSGIPIIGVPLAIAGVATMFGSYAFSKIKAKETASESFGDGHFEVLQGGSHASGHDIHLGYNNKGVERRVEGGEGLAIFKKKSTYKYGEMIPSIVDAINNEELEKMFTGGESLDVLNVGGNTFNSNVDLSETNGYLKGIKEQGEKTVYVSPDGRIIEKYKNITRTYV